MIKDLSDKQLEETIAILCGWEKEGEKWYSDKDHSCGWDSPLPYARDLNAIYRAEEILIGKERAIYCDDIMECGGGPWKCFRATARQRAEAFIKAKLTKEA